MVFDSYLWKLTCFRIGERIAADFVWILSEMKFGAAPLNPKPETPNPKP